MSSIFISHATEDKDAIARPIAKALRDLGYSVWFDEYSLKLGDSLRQGIDSGLKNCRFGIVVLSRSFFAKHWPQKELNALTAREATEGGKLILPVWHEVSARDIAEFSPLLADRLGVTTTEGIPKVINVISEVLGPPNAPRESPNSTDSLLFSFWDRNVIDWRSAVREIFGDKPPKSRGWIKLEEIVEVLSQICRPNLNNCFFPNGGGLDISGVRESQEPDCLELVSSSGGVSIIRPKNLRFESFAGFPSLSYFWIDTASLVPFEKDEVGTERIFEELAEVFPLDYRPRSVVDEGYYEHDECGNEIPVPEGTRVVTRFFRGSFVLFAKGSIYNRLRGNYDAYNAQHERLGAHAFRSFISDLIREVAAKEIELEPDRR